MNANTWSLDTMLSPQSIAMIGASDNLSTSAGKCYANLKRDFPGRLYPVNPRRPTVQGDRAYEDVESLPESVDLLIVMVQASLVPAVVERAVAAGHRSALVLSSGFSEAGAAGAALQEQLTGLAFEHDLPILGPNCIGFMSSVQHVMANFSLLPTAERPRAGSVAIISQSGGFGSFILARAVSGGLGIGYFVSTGNEATITVADLLGYMVEQPEIRVITLFSEAIRDPERFLAAADRALELDKVIISVTPSITDAVARAVMSHTATMVGSREAYDAVCRQRGILRANSIAEMVDFAAILQGGKRLRGRRIGVITPSGGAGVLMSGAADDCGLEVPELPAGRQEEIGKLIPAFGSAKNPVDTTAGFAVGFPELYEGVMQGMLDEEIIDGIVPLCWYGDSPEAEVLVRLQAASSKPIAPVITHDGQTLVHRMPVYGDPTSAVRAMAAVAEVSERPALRRRHTGTDPDQVAAARALLAPAIDHRFVLESTAKDVLALYGVPTAAEHVARDADEAVEAAAKLGGAVVLKVLSYDLPHKSDAGGVVLDVRGAAAVRAAYEQLCQAMARKSVPMEGILVQQMAQVSLELAVGMYRDPTFGPMVSAGLGGRLIELTADAVLVPAPLDLEDAGPAVARIAGGRISHATRGLNPSGMRAAAEVMVAVGRLAVDLPEVESVDINPLLPTETGLVAVDALFTLTSAPSAR